MTETVSYYNRISVFVRKVCFSSTKKCALIVAKFVQLLKKNISSYSKKIVLDYTSSIEVYYSEILKSF